MELWCNKFIENSFYMYLHYFFFLSSLCCPVKWKWRINSHKIILLVLDQWWNANAENCLLHRHIIFKHVNIKIWPSFGLLARMFLPFFPYLISLGSFCIGFWTVKSLKGKVFSLFSRSEENGFCYHIVCVHLILQCYVSVNI